MTIKFTFKFTTRPEGLAEKPVKTGYFKRVLKGAPARRNEFDQTLADEGEIYGMDNRWVWNVGLDENIKRTLAWYLSGEIRSAHIGLGS